MFRSTLYSLLLIPAFLLYTANATIRWDSLSTVQYPKYYVVHSGKEAAGDTVKLAKQVAYRSAPAGSNLVVYQNGSISNPNGDLFISHDRYYRTLAWVSQPFSWRSLPLDVGFSPISTETLTTFYCWYHNTDATTVELKDCPKKGTKAAIGYSWTWEQAQ